jgi:glucose/mannose-6-phosphate isomerase
MKTMLEMVEAFPAQWEEALVIAKNSTFSKPKFPIRQVFISGMGGSGIGANFAQELTRKTLKVPVLVGKSYSAPGWINKNTLVVISSYSGNTEETLQVFEEAIAAGCHIVCITSGGKIMEKAKELGLDLVTLPNNWSSPRACLGFSWVQQINILTKFKLASPQAFKDLKTVGPFLKRETKNILEKAAILSVHLKDKMAVIYCEDTIEPAAIRFRQQINENAKMLCWHHVIPEMNHNELVGWRQDEPNLASIWLRHSDELPRNIARTDICKDLVSTMASSTLEIMAKGKNLTERMAYLVHLTDYASVFLAKERNKDAVEIKIIEHLKNELSKL